ncbi:MAG: LPS-assembly protein LptD [Alphaproteobacteria bacterium]|nr:LPS-assembly protein LptD [Alphaproteobacteria bacterium]
MKWGYCVLCMFLISHTANAVSVDLNEPTVIKADKIEYDLKSETIKTTGKTEISNKSGQKMTLKDSYISKNGTDLSGSDIQIWLGPHVYIESENVTKDDSITIAKNSSFTACKNCDSFGEAWEISAKKIKHNLDTHMLAFYNMIFYIYDLPVMWLPYFDMPDPSVKHKTGFLTPYLESTNKMGTQINIPFYLYISDTHDVTATFSYLTRENPLFQLEHRLNSDHSEFRTRGSFTHNREGKNRWHIFHNDVIELGENARANIFLERASDKTYLQKYGFYDEQPYLDSGARIELFGQSGYMIADAHIFQELRSKAHHYSVPTGNILPNIRGIYQTQPLFAATYATFMGDVLGISGDGFASQRLIGEARVTSPWTIWGGNRITASLATRYDLYNFDNTEMIDGEMYSGMKNRFLPSGYLEWGLPLFKPLTEWTQVIEPRARMTVMRHIHDSQFASNNDSVGALLSDATLFSSNRFAGLDLWENGTFADYGVRWAAFDSDGQTIETFLGQTYDFTKREDTDPNSGFHNGQSDYVGRIGYNNMKWLNLYTRFRLSQSNLGLRHTETNAVVGTEQNFLNVGHIWSKQFDNVLAQTESIHEIMGGIGFAITDRWSVRWNAIYNVTNERFQQHSGGLYYEHPCYYLSFGYRRDNTVKEDYVGTTTFQFRFGISVDGKHY